MVRDLARRFAFVQVGAEVAVACWLSQTGKFAGEEDGVGAWVSQ